MAAGPPQCDTIIIPPGKPRLLQLEATPKTIVIQTPTSKMVRLRRHWDETIRRRVLCECDPLCPTSADDAWASVLEWVGPLTWEQKIWSIPEGAMAQLFRVAILKQQTKEMSGLKLAVRRNGSHDNSRVIIDYLGAGICKSQGFDLHSAVQHITQISVSFFGQVLTEPEVPNADQVVNPIRARIGAMPTGESRSSNGKPRLPLGTRQKK